MQLTVRATLLLAAGLLALRLDARPPTFQHEVLPVLEARCIACHGEAKQAGLDLRTLATVMAGGSSGPVLAPGDPASSLLWQVIESDKMPLAGEPLTEAEKRLLRAWIEQGVFPTRDSALAEKRQALITDEARQWWSFQPPVVPEVPPVREVSRIRTPIDRFVEAKLEERGWMIGPEADRRTLIRRASLDLIGLPPTPEEVEAFVNDPSPRAYEDLIERLLASPHYGERWGRHWLDVAGYSDSVGNAADELRPKSWEYRDYVIRAFNSDKPFDEFLLEQFAGDQLANYEPGTEPTPEQHEKLVATGFLRLPPDISDTQTIYQVDKWYDALQTTVETSLKAVLGLQLGCARCHDHKFDPILQEDYYRLTAVYQPALDPEKWVGAAIGFGEWPTRYILDAGPERRQAYIEAALEEHPQLRRERQKLDAEYARRRRALAGEEASGASAVDEDGEAAANMDVAELEALDPELKAWGERVRARERAYEELRPDRIWALWDVSKEPSDTRILLRGNYLTPGDAVEPGILAVLDDPDDPFQFPDPKPEWHHTGRRLTLARWLTQPDHPLTTRVLVNRVWQFHFGEGLVRTPDDFGSQGAPPTHPELLDWLAASFVENGWSFKWLHRQIMLSAAYRQSSAEDDEKLAADPTNRLVWRKEPLRLEAETLRDALLAVSGELSQRMFGFYEPLEQGPDGQWVVNEDEGDDHRRSLYLLSRRTGMHGLLLTFDAPPMDNQNMPQRFRSALPTQSLALMNNPFVVENSQRFAERIAEEAGPELPERVRRAFELAYSRPPQPTELRLVYDLLETANDREAAWRTLCQSLLASNEFLYSF